MGFKIKTHYKTVSEKTDNQIQTYFPLFSISKTMLFLDIPCFIEYYTQ